MENAPTIDNGTDMPNCLAVTFLGHKGVLVVNRGMQMRFYEYSDFHYREIYSFYSPSRQAGLLVADVDQDGRPDILCGNYWIRSPGQFGLPWYPSPFSRITPARSPPRRRQIGDR